MDNRELLQEITKRIDASANETRAYVDTRAEEARAFTDARIQDAVRELRVVVEAAHHPIRLIAAGHMLLVGKVDDLAVRMERVEGRVDRLGTEIVALRTVVQTGDAALREEIGKVPVRCQAQRP